MREGSEARVCQPELRNSEGAGVSPVEGRVQMSSRSSEGPDGERPVEGHLCFIFYLE